MFRRSCLLLALLCTLVPATAQDVRLAPTADGGVTITTPLYVGTIQKDGYLHSLKVAGTEMLDDAVSFSAGSYLFHSGSKAADLGAPAIDGTQVRCAGHDRELVYTFRADGFDVTAKVPQNGHYFWVFSDAVKQMKDEDTDTVKSAPGGLESGHVRMLTGDAWMSLSGGSKCWGPWGGDKPRQVFDTLLLPGTPVTLKITVGRGQPLATGVAAPVAPAAAPAAAQGAALTGSATPSGAPAILTPQADGSVVIKGAEYEGLIKPDGYLHSLQVKGLELLDDKVNISRGSYVHRMPKGVVEVGQPEINSNVATASGNEIKLVYTFLANGFTIKVSADEAAAYYWVLSPQVKQIRDAKGQAVASPGVLTTTDVSCETTGPWVRISGGNRAWAWNQRQVVERGLPANQELTLQVTVGGDAPAAGAVAAPAAPATVTGGAAQVTTQGTNLVARSPLYVATVQKDGYLHSLKVGGLEMLDDQVSFSTGTYFHTDAWQNVGTPQVSGNKVVAEGAPGKLTYTFSNDGITIDMESKVDGRFFTIGSASVAKIEDMGSGNQQAAPSRLTSADVKLLASGGPWLRIAGISSVWGPWENRQVVERAVAAGQKYTLTLTMGGQVDPVAMVDLDVWTSDEDYLTSTNLGMPFLVSVDNPSDTSFEAVINISYNDYETHQPVEQKDLKLKVAANGRSGQLVDVGQSKPGFYDVKFKLTAKVNGIDLVKAKDITIGVDPLQAAPKPYRPDDLNAFWDKTRQELAARPMNAKLTEHPSSNDRVAVYKLELNGLVDEPFYAWYSYPKDGQKHPGVLLVPGYGDHGIGNPRGLSEQGWCAIAIQVRHHDVDLPQYPGGGYMTIGIESPETYVYRDIYCMCIRALDFLCSRDEVDPDRLMVRGMSQGGGLSIATAALDRRIKFSAPEVPYLCDYPDAMKVAGSPYREIRDYLAAHPDQREQVFRTLSYFDGMNLASEIQCPVAMTVGLRDRTCPPPTVVAAFAQIKAPKQLFVYPLMGHAVAREFQSIRDQWASVLLSLR